MGKRSYNGGSTNIGPKSGWFSRANPRTEKVHAVGKIEGEAARAKIKQKSTELWVENQKLLEASKLQKEKAAARKDQLLSKRDDNSAANEPSKAALKQYEKMQSVSVVRRKNKISS